MQDDHTRNVADQQPAQQRQAQRRQGEEQEVDVPAALYDIDLRNIRLGDDMPALRHNAQLFLDRNGLADVLRRPEGCTIEALVVDPLACCKSDDDVRSLRGRPWWWLAVQMRLLVDEGTLTLAHWAALSEVERNRWADIRQLLDTQLPANLRAAATRHHAVTTQEIRQRMFYAAERSQAAEAALRGYLDIVRSIQIAELRARAEERERTTELRVEVAAWRARAEERERAAAVRTEVTTAQPAQQPVTINGQAASHELLQSEDIGRVLYDSVYNAKWRTLSYAAETDTIAVSNDDARETALSEQVDDYGVQLRQDAEDFATQHASGVIMHTLRSERGWPTSWRRLVVSILGARKSGRLVDANVLVQSNLFAKDNLDATTLCVRYEVQRAWRNSAGLYNKYIASTDLDTQPLGGAPAQLQKGNDHAVAAVVLGTPGIGKTMSGNYMVYRLLHDDNAPPYIAFAVGEYVYMFDKPRRVVSCYLRDDFRLMYFAAATERNNVYIHDVSTPEHAVDADMLNGIPLFVVLTSPHRNNYWFLTNKVNNTSENKGMVVMQSWSYRELRCFAHLYGIGVDTMQQRVYTVGPLPRHIITDNACNERTDNVTRLLLQVAANFSAVPLTLATTIASTGEGERNPTNVLYDLRRTRPHDDAAAGNAAGGAAPQGAAQDAVAAPVNFSDGGMIPYRLASLGIIDMVLKALMRNHVGQLISFNNFVAESLDASKRYELLVKQAIARVAFWRRLHDAHDGVPTLDFRHCVYSDARGVAPAALAPLDAASIAVWTRGMRDDSLRCGNNARAVTMTENDSVVIYLPMMPNFPLVDAFVLVRCAGGVHFVGVQATTAEDHAPHRSEVRSFVKALSGLSVDGTVVPDCAAGNETAQLAQLLRLFVSWSVVYVGKNLGRGLSLNLRPVNAQQQQQVAAAGNASDSADVLRALDSLAARVQQRRRGAAVASDNAANDRAAQPRADAQRDDYVRLWGCVERYICHIDFAELQVISNFTPQQQQGQ